MPNGQRKIQTKANKDQLVVGLHQIGKILEILGQIDVSWSSVQKNTTLELALITLYNVRVPAGYTGAAGKPDLDRLIAYLRKTYKDETDEALTIGKNRIVGSLVGSPYTGGGEGLPSPYTGGGEGLPNPYTGGGPYTAAGTGPYTGGGLSGIQLMPLTGTLPNRTDPPGEGVGVGILDTRLFAHPDLAGRYLADHRTLVPAATVSTPDSEAHATFIAGVVVARAPNADLVVGHVLNAYNICGSSWDVATRMAAFADAGVLVLNISFGAVTHDNKPPLVLRRTVQALTAGGVAIVAAAGNHGPKQAKMWPAALDEVVAVGAGARVPGKKDEFEAAKFSPRGKWVDLLAPGVGVRSLYKANGYATWDGTSFSAAGVSGAIAHLVETRHMTPAQAVELLRTPPSLRGKAAADGSIEDIGPA